MAKRLNEERWLEIKNEEWTQELRNNITNIKRKINEITQQSTHEQLPLVEQVIQQERFCRKVICHLKSR